MLDLLTATPDEFERHLRTIDRATSIDMLRRSARDLLEPYGLKHVVYHAIRIPSRNVSNEVMLCT